MYFNSIKFILPSHTQPQHKDERATGCRPLPYNKVLMIWRNEVVLHLPVHWDVCTRLYNHRDHESMPRTWAGDSLSVRPRALTTTQLRPHTVMCTINLFSSLHFCSFCPGCSHGGDEHSRQKTDGFQTLWGQLCFHKCWHWLVFNYFWGEFLGFLPSHKNFFTFREFHFLSMQMTWEKTWKKVKGPVENMCRFS